jgi:hypothetical protein
MNLKGTVLLPKLYSTTDSIRLPIHQELDVAREAFLSLAIPRVDRVPGSNLIRHGTIYRRDHPYPVTSHGLKKHSIWVNKTFTGGAVGDSPALQSQAHKRK